MLDISAKYVIIQKLSGGAAGKEYGGIAQLGERLNGIQEVSGSIPLISTRKLTKKQKKSVKSYDFTDFFLHSIFKLLWEKATVLELYLNWPIHAM